MECCTKPFSARTTTFKPTLAGNNNSVEAWQTVFEKLC